MVALLLLLLHSATAVTAPPQHPSSSDARKTGKHPVPNLARSVLLSGAVASHGARCLDGTAPRLWIQESRSANPANRTKWYLHLMGGGDCDTVESCAQRAYDPAQCMRGSSSEACFNSQQLGGCGSARFNETMDFRDIPCINGARWGGGPLMNDPATNPVAWDWNKVEVMYCDGNSFAGDNSSETMLGEGPEGRKLFFRGKRILQAVVDYLKESHGLGRATHFVLGGDSAGGVATFWHADFFRGALGPATTVLAVPDSGFFVSYIGCHACLPKTPPSGASPTQPDLVSIKWYTQMINSSLDRSCVAARGAAHCLNPEDVAPHIATPLFVVNSKFDLWSGTTALDINAHGDFQMQVLHASVLRNPQNGAFITSCHEHCGQWATGQTDPMPDFNVTISGLTAGVALDRWVRAQVAGAEGGGARQVAIIQRAGYPCASCCSGGDPQRWAASPWPAIPIKTEDEEAASAAGGGAEGADVEEVQPQLSTFCNPLNLGYRFRLEPPSRREAADPTMVVFDSTYFLFASKSGGYWHSPDLLNWTLVVPKGLPLEDYAPTVVVLSGRLYFTSDCFEVWTTQDPKAPSALWTKVADLKEYKDPCLFLDAGKMYMYSGAGPNLGLNVVELDPANGWQEIGTPAPTVPAQHFREIGWDCRGDNNTGDPKEPTKPPSIEGSWMNKANGTYFMQFATPGTQYKTYSDALYTSTDARGPFMSALQNPFSHKPTGFLGGSGHGSTFQALDGQHWHVATSTISVRDRFERRLSLFPLHFSGAMMWADTWLGDYPIALPRGSSTGKSAEHMGRQRDPGWQLLSRNKSVSSSSHANATADPETGRMRSYGAHLAVDEDIRTWWSAATGDSGEWIQLDLGDLCQVASLQINFADEGSSQLGRLMADNVYQYYVEVSADNIAWVRLPQLDRTHNTLDMPHDYVQLHRKVSVRYLRLTCVRSAGGSNFSVSGLRVFGSCPQQPPPAKVSPASIIVMRDRLDRRRVVVSWAAAENADFYIVRYSRHQGSEGKHSDAITPSYMYHNYQVYGLSVRINALDAQEEYAFSVDSVNENGIASSSGTGVLTA